MRSPTNFRGFLTIVISLLSFSTFAQPVNDDCNGAVQITHDASPVYYSGITIDATPSMGGTAKDVWFYFTAADSVLFVRLINSPMKYELFSGSCGSLTSLHTEAPMGGLCADIPDKILVTAGQVYYLRVYFDDPNVTQPFQVSLLGSATYDQCATVTEFPMNYDQLIDTVNFASMMYSRINPITTMPFPFTTTGGIDEVWFKFTATSTDHTVFLGSRSYFSCWTTSSFPYVYAKYDGCLTTDTMGTQTSIPKLFDSLEYVDFNSLTIGNTYYLRVWTNKMAGVSADFFAGVGPLGSVGQMPPPLSISHTLTRANKLMITPNPATTQLTIRSAKNSGNGTISIVDITGKELYQYSFEGDLSLDVSGYASGVYFVRYSGIEGVTTSKFIKH